MGVANRHDESTTEAAVDVVCIGGGLGGLAAAVRARGLGLSVLVLERSSLLGGVAAFSGGRLWVPCSHLARLAGHDDDVDEAARYLDFTVGPDADPDLDLRSAFLGAAPEAVRCFMDEADVPFQLVGDYPDQYHPAPGSTDTGRFLEVELCIDDSDRDWLEICRRGHHYHPQSCWNEAFDVGACTTTLDPPLSRGESLAAAFVRAAVRTGVEIRRNVVVRRILVGGEGVAGVEIEHEGATTVVRTRAGVVVATGSYGSSEDAAKIENLPELGDAGPPVSFGDALGLAGDIGAAVVRAGSAFTVLGADLGDGVDESGRRRMRQVFDRTGLPHGIIVNGDGDRFGDESCYNDLVEATKAFDVGSRQFRNSPCFFVCDEQYRLAYASGSEVPWEMAASFTSAPTLADLADAMGIESEGLCRTVERFNEFVESGVDSDFGRGELLRYRLEYGDADTDSTNPNLGTIATPPFWAIRLVPLSVGIHSLGLRIDRMARVVRRDRSPIDGLWATGNAVAYTEQPRYTGGFANARNIVYGFLAANSAADRLAAGREASGATAGRRTDRGGST